MLVLESERIEAAPMSTEEWELRVQLAACYRIFDLLGWSELIFNHISLRVPGPEKHFLINPFGLSYREVTASNLVKIDLQGRIIGQSRYPVNQAGFVIHSALHETVPEAHCIMHTHTTAGMAVASSQVGLQQTNFYAAMLHNEVAYHDFEGVTVSPEEKPRLVKSLGQQHCLILRNHGLLTHGIDLGQAFGFLWTLQRACEIQLAGAALGPAIPVPDEIARQTARESIHNVQSPVRFMVFDALRRQVEALDPSYKS